jgi:hypothetical protein
LFEIVRANRILKAACRLREQQECEAALEKLSMALGLLAKPGVSREGFFGYVATMMCSSTFVEWAIEAGRIDDARRVLTDAVRLSEVSPNSSEVPQMRSLLVWMRETLDGLDGRQV